MKWRKVRNKATRNIYWQRSPQWVAALEQASERLLRGDCIISHDYYKDVEQRGIKVKSSPSMIDMFRFYPTAHMSSFIFKLFLEIYHILSVIQQHLGQQAQPTSRQRAGFTNKEKPTYMAWWGRKPVSGLSGWSVIHPNVSKHWGGSPSSGLTWGLQVFEWKVL